MPHSSGSTRLRAVRFVVPLLLALIALIAFAHGAQAQILGQTVIPGPADGEAFGTSVIVLTNGNFVVTDPLHDMPLADDAGAVSLYDGATLALISRLTGSTTNDHVGGGGVTALANGNFVVRTDQWDRGAISNVGAVTWINGATGISGTVSTSNSLVGITDNDQVGNRGITALANGNYVVSSSNWDNSGATFAGAVTFGNGAAGIIGSVSAANSLVGDSEFDRVGFGGVTELGNSNYVVHSPDWHDAADLSVGAATWRSGTGGANGIVSASNSLVGSTAGDRVGDIESVTSLANDNYVVASPNWDNGATANVGAVTWGNGTTGTFGTISDSNSLVGGTEGDLAGGGVTALTNGNYVVASPNWNNAAIVDAGAATWGNGATGVFGAISAANSLVGVKFSDFVARYGVTALTNGNYVVASPDWDDGATVDAGAATWGDGASGIAGPITMDNSLVGFTPGNYVGGNFSASGVTALTNGNYVVRSPRWDNGAITDVGAVTWSSGASGIVGDVSPVNSLVGTAPSDFVGSGVAVLTNGNYVIASTNWDNGAILDVGAVTWSSGASGIVDPIVGPVSTSNSLVGSAPNDHVGSPTALTNGNYVVASPEWDNGAAEDAGAVTWGNGASATVATVSPANSLVGSTDGDLVGLFGLVALKNGNYIVATTRWDNGPVLDAGAVTWGNGTEGVSGAISASNSLVGSTEEDWVGGQLTTVYMTALANGDYVVHTRYWNNGLEVDAGAITLGNGQIGSTGTVSGTNSVVGMTDVTRGSVLNPIHDYLLVGLPGDNKVIVADFRWQLDVGKTGSGSGMVNSNQVGNNPIAIECGTNCTAGIHRGDSVTLTATPDLSSHFLGWSGACTGMATCVIATMDEAKSVTANFVLKTWNLTVDVEGTGSGTVDGAPANPIDHGTVVTLTPTPASNSVFAGWTDDCTGAGACVLTMEASKTVLATFSLKTYALMVNTAGTGSGTVIGVPVSPISHGTVVTLIPIPDATSNFAGWSGACTGAGACVVTMDAAKSVTATFTRKSVEVNVSPEGAGGTVTVEVIPTTLAASAASVPVRVGAVAASYPLGTVLQLTALPWLGYTFDGWGGDASVIINPLEVTVIGPLEITATFEAADIYLPAVGK